MQDDAKLNEITKLIKSYYSLKNRTKKQEFEKKLAPILYSDLENFFANSSVNKFFQMNSGNLEDNINIDYDGRSYVRMMKIFKQNKFTEVNYAGCNYGDKLNEIINEKDFYLRFYMPKNTIGTIGKKITRIVVMINGMNELRNFELYDILGEFFANNDIAAVLLPTPLHLNRRVREKDFEINTVADSHPDRRAIIPSKFAREKDNHQLFYLNYIKSYLEFRHLVDKITGKLSDEDRESDFGFYDNCFDAENVKITLLGYSLGGLKALGYFLKDFVPIRHNISENKVRDYKAFEESINDFKKNVVVDSCITINSGPNLLDVKSQEKITAMDEKQWEKMLSDVSKKLKKDIKTLSKRSDFEEILKFFKFFYYVGHKGLEDINANKHGRERLRNAIDNYLAVSGGADDLVSIDLIQKIFPSESDSAIVKKISLNQLIVAKGDHHPSEENSGWHEMLPLAERNILDMINSCGERHYTKSAITNILEQLMSRSDNYMEILNECGNKFHSVHYKKLLEGFPPNADGVELSEQFKKYYFRSKAFYPNFSEVIKSINNINKKRAKHYKKMA